jgi:hypothetical protein
VCICNRNIRTAEAVVVGVPLFDFQLEMCSSPTAFVNFDVFHCFTCPKVNKSVRNRFPLEQELLRSISDDEGSQFLDQNGSAYAYVVRQFLHYSPVRLSPGLWLWPTVIRLSVLQDALENSLFYARPVHRNDVTESMSL